MHLVIIPRVQCIMQCDLFFSAHSIFSNQISIDWIFFLSLCMQTWTQTMKSVCVCVAKCWYVNCVWWKWKWVSAMRKVLMVASWMWFVNYTCIFNECNIIREWIWDWQLNLLEREHWKQSICDSYKLSAASNTQQFRAYCRHNSSRSNSFSISSITFSRSSSVELLIVLLWLDDDRQQQQCTLYI